MFFAAQSQVRIDGRVRWPSRITTRARRPTCWPQDVAPIGAAKQEDSLLELQTQGSLQYLRNPMSGASEHFLSVLAGSPGSVPPALVFFRGLDPGCRNVFRGRAVVFHFRRLAL